MNQMQQRNDDEKSIFQRHISVSLQFIKENYWHCIMQMSFSDINATLCYSFSESATFLLLDKVVHTALDTSIAT